MYPVKNMCRVFKINRSSFYKTLQCKYNSYTESNKILDAKIQELYYRNKRRYGAPKIHKKLCEQGEKISLKRVQRRMNLMGLKSIVVKKYKPITTSKAVVQRPNLLQQDFSTTGINQKWCTDITYIYTQKDGWTYLASVIDLHSRKIVGWCYGTKMSSKLAVKAVANACVNVRKTEGLIIHSDMGSQYTSIDFESFVIQKGMKHSYSRKGCPYDNACIESFHSVLKKEEVNRSIYADSKQAYNAIFEYIESWYNRQRIHSSIDYRTPESVHSAIEIVA